MAEVRSDEISVDAFAQRLEKYKEDGVKLTLILGSRASALYRSKKLYELLEQLALQKFSGKTTNEKFRACYETLNKKDVFNKYDINDILTQALEEMHWQDIELYLAALIRQELFDVIISCSIDQYLQDALDAIGMSEEYYQIHNVSKEDVDLPDKDKRNGNLVMVNIFGQKRDNKYTVRRANHIGEKDSVSEFLLEETAKETIMLGYDPTWDAELGRHINRYGSDFWYISDEQPGNDRLLQSLKQRRAVLFGGIPDNLTYEHFVSDLFKRYGGKVSAHYLTQNYIYKRIMEVDARLKKEIDFLKSELEAYKSEQRTYYSK
jgi:hypothetical protein